MLTWLELASLPLLPDPRRTPRSPIMAINETQSDVLRQLGVSYSQVIDYSSKQYTATLVSPSITCRSFTQTDIGTNWHLGDGNMGLYYHLVCTLLPSSLNIVDAPQSDGEMVFFWQAKRQLRWSPARILFILVRSCVC